MTSLAPERPLPTCEEIARDLERRGRAAAAATAQLFRLREHQRTCATGPHRVFHFPATRQLVVLRDIAQVEGAACVHECDSFAAALAWTNHRLAAILATSAPRP
ncbi:MAG: hypothetical protein KF715_18430 [Candidatus Didemnitutus sp.]|nr:hypothetical protein [Candidatus Didemnitutus sp.]